MKETPKIMVIDDDPDFVNAISMMLKVAKYDVVAAFSPEQVREKMFAHKPDLILIDSDAEGSFDARVLCSEIKSSPRFRQFNATPVVFIASGKKDPGERAGGEPLRRPAPGPDAIIVKPLKMEEMLFKIDALLKRQKP
ncbi:MAG: response regulator [Pseudomonadota bacterium]